MDSDEICKDPGNTSWVLISSVLVLGMMPGLAFFEAGLLRRKSALSVLTQVFAGIVILQLLWYLIGFSLVFDGDYGGVIGGVKYGLYWNVANVCLPLGSQVQVRGLAFATFQSMFAAITPLLMTGCVAERMRMRAFLIIIILWEAIVYYPVAHWIWGGGWLQQLGVLDFAGGIVIHATSGCSSLVLAIALGRRKGFEKHHGEYPPHNMPLAMIGGAFLWMGWYGFNAGSALSAGKVATYAVSNTTMAACSSCVVWIVIGVVREGYISPIAVLNGFVAGLAGVTPASGYIESYYAALLGVILGLVSYFSIMLFKGVLKIDDALDVSSVHGMTGIVGSYCIALFASQDVNPHITHKGMVYGGFDLLYIQLIGLSVAVAWSVGWTIIFCFGLKFFTRIRVSEEREEKGLDNPKGHRVSAYDNLHSTDNLQLLMENGQKEMEKMNVNSEEYVVEGNEDSPIKKQPPKPFYRTTTWAPPQDAYADFDNTI